MSGFEVVGVVLGAIPIIITAIEKYQSTKKYMREMKALKRALETERLILEDTCEKLLVTIVPLGKMKDFLDDPFGPLWKTEEIENLVRQRLWKSYTIFKETVQEMRFAVNELGRRLGLNIPAQAQHKSTSNVTLGGFNGIRDGIRLILRRSQFEELLKTIENGNSTLTKLLTTGVDREVEAARQSQSRGRYFKLARQCSRSVLDALESSISCPCRTLHSLNLKLPSLSPYPTPEDDDKGIISGIIFDVAFVFASMDKIGKSNLPKWKRLELKTHAWEQKMLLRAEALPGSVHQATKLNSRGLRTTSASRDQTMSAKRLKQTHVFSGADQGVELDNMPFHPHQSQITDLCSDLDRACKNSSQVECYGIIASDSPLNRNVFLVNPGHHNADIRGQSGETLEDLLEFQSQQSMGWSFRNKHIFAAKVSSSILQLSGSQWLPDVLSSADITFLEQSDQFTFEHPFLTKRLQLQANETPDLQTAWAAACIRQRLIFSLGIVLLEVALGKTLYSMNRDPGSPISLTSRNLLAEYEIATEHLDQVERAVGAEYAQAVRICIRCEFMSPVLDLDEDGFRHEVYSKVVALLEKNARISVTPWT